MTTWKLLKVEKETESKCWHCQTNIKYACWIESSDGEIICVGRDCCGNFLSRKDQKLVERGCKTLFKYHKIKKAYDTMCESTNPTMNDKLYWLNNRVNWHSDIAQEMFNDEFKYQYGEI